MEEKLQVLILDDEPIVGKRLGPALAKMGGRWRSLKTRTRH